MDQCVFQEGAGLTLKVAARLFFGVSVPKLQRSVVGGRDDDAVGEFQVSDPVQMGLRTNHHHNHHHH